ncbi:uncharacterized protein LOC131993070 [Centropristis striata]|uniref:uncharacterized protein LOC131993070 n=1 Tax=Centropristis striata TaxID=184440 RepID=UPI0027E0A8BA|nr:uncharacterized protein LOC131993070 [Centropristis striata]
MAAALFRRGAGLCVTCIHRELCRVVWRPQAALYSSKSSDRKQPRKTHIKKAKPQPAVDVAKLLEQIFSQQRPGTAPPAGKVRPAKASSLFTKPPPTSSVRVSASNAPPFSKTEPAVSVFPAASSLKHADADTSTETAALQYQPSTETIETKVETAAEPIELTESPLSAYIEENNAETSPFPAATVEPFIETTVEPPIESIISPAETLEVIGAVVEGPVESTIDAPTEETQASGVVDVTHTAKEERLIETAIESQIETSNFPVETRGTRAAVAEGPVKTTIDVTVDVAAQKVETKSTESGVVDISHTTTVEPTLEKVEPSFEARTSHAAVVECAIDATVESHAEVAETNNFLQTAEEEPLLETTIDASVEASTLPLETLESRAAVAESSVETTIEAEAETAQTAHTSSTDLSHCAKEEPLIETGIESPVEANHFSVETLETRADAVEGPVEPTIDVTVDVEVQKVETTSTDSGVICITKEEPLIEATIEAAVDAPVPGGTIETEAAENLSHTALIQNAIESAPLPLKNEPIVESDEGVNRSEEMTLESVTLLEDKVLVASLEIDELLQTKSFLDEKAEKQLQELLVQTETGVENEAAAETECSSEDESEILIDVLSKWDSLSKDLKELEGESGMLLKELSWLAPAVLFKPPGTSSATDPPVGVEGECVLVEEKVTEAESMTLESITLANVKAEVGSLEAEVLQEARNALEKEADVFAEKEKMEVTPTVEDVSSFEDTAEADILTLDSISETTEAEMSVMQEAMFGSEQGLTQPLQKAEHPDESTGLEAENEPREQQEVSVIEAMSLESVTLAEVEASLGSLENKSLSETADYLEKEAEIVAGGKRTEVEEIAVSEETAEALEVESLFLPEADVLAEDLQMDALMEELLFSGPGHMTEGSNGQEIVRADISDETVSTTSVDVDTAPAVSDDFPASPALKEELLEEKVEKEEKGAQAEALGNEDGTGTHADLEPVQRLFLDKIREYKNMHRLNGGLLEAEPDYEKYLLEETAKLQRLYGGGDLNSFPQFTFIDPEMDQDSK